MRRDDRVGGEAGIVHLRSSFYQRDIDISSGPFSCDIFSRAPGSPYFIAHHHLGPQGVPYEASVKISGAWFDVGIHKHKEPLWQARGGSFKVSEVRVAEGSFGPLTTLVCQPASASTPRIEVEIEYELSEELPFYRKSMRVTNRSASSLEIQNLSPEICYSVRIGHDLVFLHDFRRPVSSPDEFFAGYTRHKFPKDIDHLLAPGAVMESFNLYGVFTPNDPEGRSVWTGRVLKRIAPWIENRAVSVQCDAIAPNADADSVAQFVALADHCAEMGVEKVTFFVNQLWTNIGDYEVRRDLFPNGVDDLKRVIDYFHGKGLKVGPYTSYAIAWHGSEARERHLEWECVGADGQHFNPGALGNMCFASPWGDHIRKKLLWLVDEMGFDELHIDGPTNIPCHQKGHYHHNEADYEYLNWEWERDLFKAMRSRDVHLTIPRDNSYLLMGANQLPGGYAEEDFCHSSGMAQIVNCRARMYHARYGTPACAAWAFLAVDAYHRHSIEISEERPWIYDHALGGLFGYGHSGLIHGTRLHVGPKTKDIFLKWRDFHHRYRHTVTGDFIHVARPDGTHADAVLHTHPDAKIPAVAVVFNPLDKPQRAFLAFPLAYANFGAGDTAFGADGTPLPLDDAGTCVMDMTLTPYEIRIVEFNRTRSAT